MKTKLTVRGPNTKVTGNYGDFNLDAAYAHALVAAMGDLENSGDVCGITFTMKDVERRASELMSEWGYVND